MDILKNIPDKRVDKNTTSLKFKQDLIDFFRDKKLSNCIEVGTNLGYTTSVLSDLFESVYTIEYDTIIINKAIQINKNNKNITFINGDAYGTDWDLPGKFDAGFIDCNHEKEYVKSDIRNCLKYIDKEMYLIFDDYGLPETVPAVKEAVDEFVNTHNIFYDILLCKPIGETVGDEPRVGRPLVDHEGIILHIRKTDLKKVFIDAGANIGQSIENFINSWDDWFEYDIHSFEANPRLTPYFDKFKDIPNIHFYNKAVWLNDGTVEFYLCNDGLASSSVMGNKKTGNLDKHPTIVPSIDISKFIMTNFKKEDFIILKLDIEGGEYELIEHMIDTKAFDYVDMLYLEFHTGKVNKTKEDNELLLERMKSFPGMKVNHESYNSFNFL